MKTEDTLLVLGETVTAKATAEETAGAMTAVEVVTPPDGGPPPHTHHYAELLYVPQHLLRAGAVPGSAPARWL